MIHIYCPVNYENTGHFQVNGIITVLPLIWCLLHYLTQVRSSSHRRRFFSDTDVHKNVHENILSSKSANSTLLNSKQMFVLNNFNTGKFQIINTIEREY